MVLDPKRLKYFQAKEELGKNPSRVGQAVYDILNRQNSPQEVGETLEMMAPDYVEELKDCIRNNVTKFDAPFYIVVMGKKEMFAMNVLRHWFVARQTEPTSQVLMHDYPNHFHEVFEYNKNTGDCRLLWALPATWCHAEIINHPETYHPQLVKWIMDHYGKKSPSSI